MIKNLKERLKNNFENIGMANAYSNPIEGDSIFFFHKVEIPAILKESVSSENEEIK
ncbi:hypothetical protein [Eubacterium ruminantium]|uniref:Uncharacterized protein n=1 Tax=Eubacterium ruminantium TaxID=42322 RepID=A0A1T4N6Z9_9FIRM|nr:hypothetical protein [Eubacterium ruminantium]SCW52128.1 hypothetical protein SAMN05660484_01509 [Eubacterium ruminantium]SDM64481.1 hypothetical protein SAMN04490370_10518 [Eubacterium ruminantium]SJZ75090.1 hypothetical protein SAMN02745110_01509 [Eubacterium ruminantium]